MPTACSRIAAPFGLWLLCLNVFADEPPRVVTLAPHLTELVYAIQAEELLVGVVEYSDFPPAAQSLPRIGDAFRFDMERILNLDADIALAWAGGTPRRVADDLTRLGIEVYWLETRRMADLPKALRGLGQRLSMADAGQAAARQFEQELGKLRQRHAGLENERRVFYQISRRPLYTLGGAHIFNDALSVCAMVNVFVDLPAEAAVVSREAVIDAQPDLILGSDPISTLAADWQTPGFRSLIQVEVQTIDPDLLTRPSPRILDGIRELCELRAP